MDIKDSTMENIILQNKIFEMYNETGLGKCAICKKCKNSERNKVLVGPSPLWHIGKHFNNPDNNRRILFVGKEPRFETTDTNLDFIGWMEKSKDLFLASSWAFWKVIRETSMQVFGADAENAFSKIAISNFVKCSRADESKGGSQADASRGMIEKCSNFLKAEIHILAPTHLVFFSPVNFDKVIRDFFDNEPQIISQKIDTGVKKPRIWTITEYSGTINHRITYALRCGHPEQYVKHETQEEILLRFLGRNS